MKIAMIGAGAAGSVFASYLKLGGAELCLVDRYKEHMDKVAADGMRFISPLGEKLLTGFSTFADAENVVVADIVILMVKASQTDSVMRDIAPCFGENTVAVSLQNGLGNETVLQKYVPAERVLFGFGTIGTELPAPGVCVSKPESGVVMRFGASKPSELSCSAGRYLEQCFRAGGCCAVFENDIRPFVWKKAISSSGYNTLSSILRLKVGPMLGDESGRELVRAVWSEGCAVAHAACGIDLTPDMLEELPRLADGFADYYPSMAQDILIKQRQTEIEQINGAIVSIADRYGVQVPINRALVLMVRCIQNNYEKQFR